MRFNFTFRSARLFSIATLAVCVAAQAEVVDRVEIAIGNEAITESQLIEELRVTALLNHAPVRIDPAAKRQAAEHLVQQFLIIREIEVSHFPTPDAKDVEQYEQQVEHNFGGPAALQRSLRAYGLSPAVLERHLALQLQTLRFTEFRFPTDEALSVWLDEARKRFRIVYLDKALQ